MLILAILNIILFSYDGVYDSQNNQQYINADALLVMEGLNDIRTYSKQRFQEIKTKIQIETKNPDLKRIQIDGTRPDLWTIVGALQFISNRRFIEEIKKPLLERGFPFEELYKLQNRMTPKDIQNKVKELLKEKKTDEISKEDLLKMKRPTDVMILKAFAREAKIRKKVNEEAILDFLESLSEHSRRVVISYFFEKVVPTASYTLFLELPEIDDLSKIGSENALFAFKRSLLLEKEFRKQLQSRFKLTGDDFQNLDEVDQHRISLQILQSKEIKFINDIKAFKKNSLDRLVLE